MHNVSMYCSIRQLHILSSKFVKNQMEALANFIEDLSKSSAKRLILD